MKAILDKDIQFLKKLRKKVKIKNKLQNNISNKFQRKNTSNTDLQKRRKQMKSFARQTLKQLVKELENLKTYYSNIQNEDSLNRTLLIYHYTLDLIDGIFTLNKEIAYFIQDAEGEDILESHKQKWITKRIIYITDQIKENEIKRKKYLERLIKTKILNEEDRKTLSQFGNQKEVMRPTIFYSKHASTNSIGFLKKHKEEAKNAGEDAAYTYYKDMKEAASFWASLSNFLKISAEYIGDPEFQIFQTNHSKAQNSFSMFEKRNKLKRRITKKFSNILKKKNLN